MRMRSSSAIRPAPRHVVHTFFPTRPVPPQVGHSFSRRSDSDGAGFNAGALTIDFGIALPAEATYAAGELKVGDTVSVTFNVKIN